ncbi:hypothetical protein CWS01_03570 [Niallia nealsonii]|uniref:Uncharacterized protein n=1 Tax=Niallia nealsonii TaxID=115979 RepID=A0A2N0Z613_9BACI|nr:hypothetical protein CWS01_03570 [Niallia nealsonii]
MNFYWEITTIYVGKVAVNGICRYLLKWRKNIFLKLGWYRAYFASLHIDAGAFFVAREVFLWK